MITDTIKMYQVETQQRQSPSPNKLTGPCFVCNKVGHWAKDCPTNSNSRSPASRPVNSDQHFPAIHCRCGAGLCRILISGSLKNPNRKYYKCPGEKYMDCGYFWWCDKLTREEMREVQPEKYPICTCGAGVSYVQVDTNGVYAGRKYFACPITKGQGACNFKQWLDDSLFSSSISFENPAADMLDEELSLEAEMQIAAIETLSREIPGEEESAESHPSPVENAVVENLGLDNMQASFTSGYFPPLVAHQGDGILSNPECVGPSEGSLMTDTILMEFEKVALRLRNNLIISLESMSPHNHESMTKEADRIFGALNCLDLDYSLFQRRVNEYIKQAASLAHIDKIINDDTFSQELVDHRDNEQQRFEELLKSHDEAKATLMAFSKLLCEKASSLDGSAESIIEWSSCQAEIIGCRETLLQITKTMAECKESLQAASVKAEEALKVSEDREMERRGAQAAFQMAKAQLRN